MTTTTSHVDTGVEDPLYDLILLVQQALEDCYRFQCFSQDARAGGDDELADLFDELAESDRSIAHRAKRLLADRICEQGSG